MRTSNRIDTSTLGWVKTEIDQTLGQAREALQRYVDSDDPTPLRLFANSVHQVAGTLQMVELDGAAQIAQETETLASAMVAGKIEGTGSQTASGLLGEGVTHLSEYMERLANGFPDRPIDNVDVINELRRARQAEELDPFSLFHPDLETYPAKDAPAEEIDGDDYTQRVRDLRRRFQPALLGWLRDQGDDEAWQGMADVVTELYGLSRFRVSMQVWWVARAYLDALRPEELGRDDPRKHALAQLDQLMRKLVEDSEAAIAREGPEKLVRFMLYHVGRSGERTGATRAVIRLFDLDTLLGIDSDEPAAPGASAFATLAGRAAQPLRAVQSALDEYSRSGDADAFAESEPRLREVTDAARETGVEELAELSSAISGLLFEGDEPVRSEEVLLGAARALLFIERTLDSPEEVGEEWPEAAAAVTARISGLSSVSGADSPSMAIESREIDTDTLEAHELRRLVVVVAGQIADNLKQAEHNLEQYSKDQSGNDSLVALTGSLQQVHGAVRMLGQHKLCDLLELAISQIRALMDGDAYPSDELLDALAVAVGTTDACVKGLESDAPNIETLLKRATRELEAAAAAETRVDIDPAAAVASIQESFDAWIADNGNYEAFRVLRRNIRDLGALAHEWEELSLQRIAQEMTNLLDIVTDDPSFLSDEVEETLRRSLSTLIGLAEPLQEDRDGDTGSPVLTEYAAATSDYSGEADDLVRETFDEEARECLQEIESGLETLGADHANGAVLADLRRGFHTIKGSGRMARAGDIAELAWIAEDIFNRCLDEEIPVSQSVVDFASRVRRELGGLLDEGLDSSTDLNGWRESAASLLREGRQSPPAGDSQHPEREMLFEAAQAVPTPPARAGFREDGRDATRPDAEAASDSRGDPPLTSIEDLGDQGPNLAVDPDTRRDTSPFSDDEVIKIFSKEALSHIASIRMTVDECARKGEAPIGDELLRAVHTLQGNARSLHLVEMSEAYKALDTQLNDRKSRGVRLHRPETEILDKLLIATAKVLDHLNRDKRFPDVIRQELEDLAERITESWGAEPGPGHRKPRPGGLELVSSITPEAEGAPGDGARTEPASVFDELEESAERPPEAEEPSAAGEQASPPLAAEPAGAESTADDDELGLEDVFMEEAADILSRFESTLQRGKQSGVDADLANNLKRELHTLKGSSRAAGIERIAGLSHDAETMLEAVAGTGDRPDDLLGLLEEVHDTLASMVQGLETGRPGEPDRQLIERLRGGSGFAPGPKAEKPAPPVSLIPEEDAAPPRAETIAAAPADAAAEPAEPRGPRNDISRTGGGRATVRIQSNVLDKLVNYAGEVSISRSQLEEQLSGLKGNLNELRANVVRFSDQVRELDIQADTQIRSRVAEEQVSDAGHDFDPLEMDRYSRLQQLSRSLSESVDDLMTIQSGLNRFATQTEGVLSQQALLNSELQDGLMSARMVPFNTLVPRLRHQARQTARELGKDIELTVTGGDLEVDRNILDQLSEALEHMIRNSLDHGIESVEAREQAGKPARGNLRIDCRQEGNEVVLKFSDDGAGLDVERIKARAVEAGLLAPDADLNDDEVIQLIVLSGFTTAASVTQVSGRGVGLDVVNDAVRRLSGSLAMDNRLGEGVSFELRLPLSLSITQAMFVRCGDQRFAIPLGAIEQVLKTEPGNLSELSKDGDPVFKRDDRVYTLMDLTAALGLEPSPSGNRVPVLLVRMGARDVAVRVDDLVGTDEIVVKQLGDHLGRMSGIHGATITGDGSVVLILDLAALWLAQERLPAFAHKAPKRTDTEPRVMVVDDSLTVRKVTGRNLGRHGMEVTMARDGLDALEQMAEARPDLMLVDIEMPRMDGYELTTRIREDPNYRDIPIIVITSRAGAKHREKAMELGANAYLSKPYQERELLEEVTALLNRAQASPVH